VVAEQEEASFRRGKQRLKEGRPDEALDAFLSVIDHRNQAPESHLEAGLLYLDRFNEPVLAIYHFNEFLRLNPNSEQADRVKALIISAKKEFARTLPAAPFAGEVDRLDLKDLLDKTRAENDQLKAQVAQLRDELERMHSLDQARMGLIDNASGSKSTVSATAPSAIPAAAAVSSGKTYKVADGDTLSSIAKKLWGASSRWPDIYNANRDRLASPAALKIGQELRIP
jgi:LysM repeat protein